MPPTRARRAALIELQALLRSISGNDTLAQITDRLASIAEVASTLGFPSIEALTARPRGGDGFTPREPATLDERVARATAEDSIVTRSAVHTATRQIGDELLAALRDAAPPLAAEIECVDAQLVLARELERLRQMPPSPAFATDRALATLADEEERDAALAAVAEIVDRLRDAPADDVEARELTLREHRSYDRLRRTRTTWHLPSIRSASDHSSPAYAPFWLRDSIRRLEEWQRAQVELPEQLPLLRRRQTELEELVELLSEPFGLVVNPGDETAMARVERVLAIQAAPLETWRDAEIAEPLTALRSACAAW